MRASLLFNRLSQLVPVLLGASALVFAIVHLTPGDPIELMMGQAGQVSEVEIEEIRRHYGLDRPLAIQFLSFLAGALRGDLGTSYVHHRPVTEVILEALPATVELTLFSLVLALAAAVPVGVLTAIKRNSPLDKASITLSLLGVSLPGFWLGLLLIFLCAVSLKILPVSGRISPMVGLEPLTGFYLIDSLILRRPEAFWDALKHLILPAIAMGAPLMAVSMRMTRATMLEVLSQDYILYARAKGLPNRLVYGKHALRNALVPTIAVVAVEVGALLGGNMVVETVFAWPGIGRLAISAIEARNYPLIQAVVLLYALTYVCVNLAADLISLYLNPRSAG